MPTLVQIKTALPYLIPKSCLGVVMTGTPNHKAGDDEYELFLKKNGSRIKQNKRSVNGKLTYVKGAT